MECNLSASFLWQKPSPDNSSSVSMLLFDLLDDVWLGFRKGNTDLN